MSEVLRSILDTIQSTQDTRPVVVFDLDGTLYDNRPRTLRIAHAYAANLGEAERVDAEKILALTVADLKYRLDDSMRPSGISEPVIKGAQAHWFKRFFTDAACADDVPVRWAVRFVRACYERGATVVYLTGRDIPNMLVGTVRTLRDDGFPIGVPGVELILKPTFEENDTVFKQGVLSRIGALGRVVATFENEPGNANMFARFWPEAHTVLLKTSFAPGAPAADEGVVWVDDFRFA